ncbi:MAG TPA: hydroxymethylbilane synthase [Acidimicrobiales bacterium]|nr:hydroxymethylbilane synthase [Acidimicrobiales bacterium]
MRLRVATRGSALALWQAERVVALLQNAEPGLDAEIVRVDTKGDRRLDVPIWELGGKGVFAKEVQAAVLDGRADVAVHSAKDLPSTTPSGLVIGATPERGDVRDALVGTTLDGLPEGATVATGSLRRRAQLAHVRPDLRFEGLRGNMATRLARAADVDAIVVAATAFDRLGLSGHITERLDPEVMLPQVAQGALAVECRTGDADIRVLLDRVEHGPTRGAVDAERGFLAELGGDCSLPAAAYATSAGSTLRIRGLLAAPDGSLLVRHEVCGPVASGPALGRQLARHLLDEQGGAKLLGR